MVWMAVCAVLVLPVRAYAGMAGFQKEQLTVGNCTRRIACMDKRLYRSTGPEDGTGEWNKGDRGIQPTDSYGNVIDWDVDGIGNEDAAGKEDSTDWMEAPTYSREEQEEILGKIERTAVTEDTGCLHIRCDLGDGWPGYNVAVALYDGNGRRWEVTVYDQNGYEARETLPAGIYKVYRAYIPGDEGGNRYPLVTSESRVAVGKDAAGELVIKRADVVKKKEATGQEEKQKARQEVQTEQRQPVIYDMAAALLVLVCVFLAVLAGVVGIEKWAERSYYQ